jgi:hypothetical protein
LCCKDISEKWAKFGYLIVSGGILNVLEPVISSFPVLRVELHVSAIYRRFFKASKPVISPTYLLFYP